MLFNSLVVLALLVVTPSSAQRTTDVSNLETFPSIRPDPTGLSTSFSRRTTRSPLPTSTAVTSTPTSAPSVSTTRLSSTASTNQTSSTSSTISSSSSSSSTSSSIASTFSSATAPSASPSRPASGANRLFSDQVWVVTASCGVAGVVLLLSGLT